MISMNVFINMVHGANVAIFSFMEKLHVSSLGTMLTVYIYMMIFSAALNIP